MTNRAEELFGVTPEKYKSLSPTERVDLSLNMACYVMGLTDDFFEESVADWAIVGGIPPRVIKAGIHPDRTDGVMFDEISEQLNAVPLIVNRPGYSPDWSQDQF